MTRYAYRHPAGQWFEDDRREAAHQPLAIHLDPDSMSAGDLPDPVPGSVLAVLHDDGDWLLLYAGPASSPGWYQGWQQYDCPWPQDEPNAGWMWIWPRESYDGVDLLALDDNAVIESDRTHANGPRGWWMGRVYALRHPDPAKIVLATDVQFCRTLSHSTVRDWRGTLDHAVSLVDAELDRWDALAQAGQPPDMDETSECGP